MTILSFCQNDSLIGESLWQNNRMVTHILFDLCLFKHFSPVANFGYQSLCMKFGFIVTGSVFLDSEWITDNVLNAKASIDRSLAYIPQLTEQGDQSLHEVTAQSGLAKTRVSASGLSPPGHVASVPAQLRRSVVSTWGHFFRPIRFRNLRVLSS